MNKIIITAAVTGAVHVRSMSPYLPITPQEIIDDSVRACEAGAAVVHIHARNPETGEPSSDKELMKKIISGIKQRCDVIVCITTGGSQMMTVKERLSPIPLMKPELASCNAGSMNFVLADLADRIKESYPWEKKYFAGTRDHVFANTYLGMEQYINVMNENGTRPEFEVYDAGMINNIAYFVRQGIVKRPIYLEFVLGIQGGIPATPDNLVFLRNSADKLLGEYVWSAAAAGKYQMSNAAVALALGGNVRIGLEDNLFIRPGQLAHSNADQVKAVRTMAEILGKEIATPAQAREILGLKGKENVGF